MKPIVISLLAFGIPLAAQDSGCPTDVFLDVSQYPGAGEEYPMPTLEVECEGDTMVVRSNGIPHYEFVQITPNLLLVSDRVYRISRSPKLAEQPSPIPLLGTVGVAINGIPFFGPNEGGVPFPGFGDPIYNSIMDACMGHTAREYHYHALVEACLGANLKPGDPSPILAYAVDGFPVYGPFGCADKDCSDVIRFRSSWEELREPETDSWDAFRYVAKNGAEYLDRCNGHSGPDHEEYHYHITETWPYILGCFSGTPSTDSGGEAGPPPGARPRPGRGRPPLDKPPTPEQISQAADKLDVDEKTLASALRLAEGRIVPMNFAASSRALGIETNALYEALGMPARRRGPPGPPPGAAPPPGEEPPCRFRCDLSDDNAIGCGLTPEHKVICTRPCDNNKCG